MIEYIWSPKNEKISFYGIFQKILQIFSIFEIIEFYILCTKNINILIFKHFFGIFKTIKYKNYIYKSWKYKIKTKIQYNSKNMEKRLKFMNLTKLWRQYDTY